jgi:DNA-binding NarL/FixJ family response regulator
MKRKTRVMLVEDHPEYREVIAIAVGKEPDLELSGTFGAAEVALRSLQDLTTRIEPEIVLLDINLPGISGLEAIPFFRSAIPDAKIIILSQSDKEADVLRAITKGAAGYLLKSSTVRQIKEGIRSVIGGDAPLDAGVAKHIMQAVKATPPLEETERALSPRELEILSMLGEGLVKKEIGNQLNITYGTVATHVRNIYEKLKVHNTPAAITMAYRTGILPAETDE